MLFDDEINVLKFICAFLLNLSSFLMSLVVKIDCLTSIVVQKMIHVTFIEVDFNERTHSYYGFANLINVADILILGEGFAFLES